MLVIAVAAVILFKTATLIVAFSKLDNLFAINSLMSCGVVDDELEDEVVLLELLEEIIVCPTASLVVCLNP
ncbi:hypothetical protein J6P59_06325 [bacterium]|nr:hypothetical protein [bacterium]